MGIEVAIAINLRHLADSIEKGSQLLPIEIDHRATRIRRLSPDCVFEEHEPYILARAKAEFDARRRRSEFLDDALFGEPAWDILLDALIHRLLRKRVTVTSACIASAVPPTTALRWINLLVDQEWLVRTASISDRRRAYVGLSDKGWKRMRRYFLYRKARRSSEFR